MIELDVFCNYGGLMRVIWKEFEIESRHISQAFLMESVELQGFELLYRLGGCMNLKGISAIPFHCEAGDGDATLKTCF